MEPPVSIWSQPPKGYGRIRPLSEQFMVQKKQTDDKSAPQTTPNASNSERKATSGEIYKSYRNEVLVKTDPSVGECSLTFSITPAVKDESKELLKAKLMRNNTERPLDLRISKENGNMFSINLPKPVNYLMAKQTRGCQTECISNPVQTENVKLPSSEQNSLKVDVEQTAPLTCSITFPNQNSIREQNGSTLNNSVSNPMKLNSFTTLKLEVNHMSTNSTSENSVSIVDINQNSNLHISYQGPSNENRGTKIGINEAKTIDSSPNNSSVNVEKKNELDRRDGLIFQQENEVNKNLEVRDKFNEGTIAECVNDATSSSLKLPDKTANKEMCEQKLPNKDGIKCGKTNTEKSIDEIIHDINRRERYKRRLRRQRRLKVDIKRICSFLSMGFAKTSTFGVRSKAYKKKRRKLFNTASSRTKTKDSQIVKGNQLPSKKENTNTDLTKSTATKTNDSTYNNVECLKLLPPGITLSKITVKKPAKERKQNNVSRTDVRSIDQKCENASNDQERNDKHKESLKDISEHQTDHNQTLLIEEKQKNENNNLENLIETKLELNQKQVNKRQLKTCNKRKVSYRRKNKTYKTVLRKSPRLPANRQTYIAAYESSSEETNKSHKRKIKSSIKRKSKLHRSGKRFKKNNTDAKKENACIIIIDSSEEDESDNINKENSSNTITNMNRNRDSVIKLNVQSRIPIESENNPDDVISNILNTNKEIALHSATKPQDVQLPETSVIDNDTFLPKYLKKLHKYPLPPQTPTHQPNYNFPNQITDVTVPIVTKTPNSKTALKCHKRVLRDPRRKPLNIEDFRVNGPINIPTFDKTNYCSEEKQKDFEKNTLLVKQILRQATGCNEIRSDENDAKNESSNEKLKEYDFNESSPSRWRSLRNVRKFKPASEALDSPQSASNDQGLKIRIFKENRSHKVQML